jgi:thiamine-phosphate pyrophosphorylase
MLLPETAPLTQKGSWRNDPITLTYKLASFGKIALSEQSMNPALALPRVYPILDTATLERLNLDAVQTAEAFLEGGARIIQFRHKAFWRGGVFAQAEQIAALCREANALFIVNDRADYALLAQTGLHLGQDDLLPGDARAVVGPAPVIGFSTHNEAQMRAARAEPIDYLAFGPVFATASKDRPDPTVGIAGLRAARALTSRPLVAIGGVTRDNATHCWSAGADSVAVISGLFPPSCDKRAIRERMVEWHRLSSR